MDRIGILVGDLNAELLYCNSVSSALIIVRAACNVGDQPTGSHSCPSESRREDRTSSMAITTSTVSKLSKPRSFAKCALSVICRVEKVSGQIRGKAGGLASDAEGVDGWDLRCWGR
jgi:hypothetical protein